MARETPQAPGGSPASEDSAAARIDQELQTENLIDTYQVLSEWIRFADAKAAVVMTIGGAVAGLMIPTLKPYLALEEHVRTWWPNIVTVLFALWLGTLVLSFYWAFRCVLPFRRKGEHPANKRCPHFHPVGVTAKYGMDDFDKFFAGFEAAQAEGFQKEVLAGILIDSHISAAKYTRVTWSIRTFAVSAVFALMYLLAIQF
ncbi:MAG: hypothetical protein MPJ50_15780 [Pirellulales bacterium]|nr:hypothetical protein [Pirellulales bacterium]